MKPFHEIDLTDFSDVSFRTAFQMYFEELGIRVQNWDGLFREIQEGENSAFLHVNEEGQVIGFLLFTTIRMKSWFFEEDCGFLREFWIAPEHRSEGHGAALLDRTEEHFRLQGIHRILLTTDTAPGFYEKNGYSQAPGIQSKNGDPVFQKQI